MDIHRIKEEDYNKIYVISDIHGNMDLFSMLLNKIDLKKNDLLIIAGDSCDRGENTSIVYSKIINLINDGYNVIHLLGNHENMCIEFLINNKNEERWMRNGGLTTIESYLDNKVSKEHLDFMSEMPLIVESENFIIVHAGIRPGVELRNQTRRDLIWIRGDFYEYQFKDFKTIIYGHTINEDGKIKFLDDKIAIDCGSYYNFVLGAIELKTKKVYYSEKTEES